MVGFRAHVGGIGGLRGGGNRPSRGRNSLTATRSRPDLGGRPQADDVAKSLRLLLAQVSAAPEFAALPAAAHAKRGFGDRSLSEHIAHIAEQGRGRVSSHSDEFRVSNLSDEQLVGPTSEEHKRDHHDSGPTEQQ